MPIIQPRKARHSILEEGSTLKITIPSRKSLYTILFLGVWMGGWVFGEVSAAGQVFGGLLPNSSQAETHVSGGIDLFTLVWLVGWTIGGVFALYTLLWQLAGKEKIEVSYESIKVQRAVLGLGRVKEYLAAHVKSLRVAPPSDIRNQFGRLRSLGMMGASGGILTFDYGAETAHFGEGIDEAEAKQILETILLRFPNYRGK